MMLSKLWRKIPLFMLLLQAVLLVCYAQEPISEHDVANQDVLQDESTQYEVGYTQQQEQDNTPEEPWEGATLVDEAMSILRRKKPTTGRLARFHKPSGVLGTTVYYAKSLLVLLFMNAPTHPDLLTTESQPKKLSAPLSKAVALLDEAVQEHGNPDALWLLAEMNFYGNFTHPRNYTRAFEYYHQLSRTYGNSSAQHMVGFMYATGVGGAVEQDQAKALLYHTFAAEDGNIRSQMTLAYRHHTGIGTPRDCEKAVYWYSQVAEAAVRYYQSGPPGGHSLVKNAYRLADETGGVYGEGASVSSAGINAKQGGPTSDAYADLDDVLEFLDFQSRKGDIRATFNLGRLYYDGNRGLERDFRQAKDHFMQVARLYWTPKGAVKQDVAHGVERLASKAAGYLGRMFLRGEGTEVSYAKAKIWFERGLKNGDALCQYGLGLMYIEGMGVPKNPLRAADYFAAAADQDLAVAQTAMGELFLDQNDVQAAWQYFDHAIRSGHITAFYYLAEMAEQGIGRDRHCGMAAAYYKMAAEKAEVILSSFVEANEAYDSGDLETALIEYMMAAEQGFENAQANVAYILDSTRPRFDIVSKLIPQLRRSAAKATDAALALIYWTRSARQSNIDSLVKMGDYYLAGIGTPQSVPSAENAAACYQAAAETMHSAQAMWNLGWMHENGVGIEQDFHLAKRFYDQALEANAEAYLPVKLSLIKLRLRSWWNDVRGGDVRGIKDEEAPRPPRTFTQWLNDFLEADAAYNDLHADAYEPDDWDPTTDHSDYASDYHNHAEDFFDEEIDDGIIESLVIIGLAAALAFLVYYRQARQVEARRRQQEEQGQGAAVAADGNQQQQQQDRGLFPDPNNPEFANWIAGGVGH